MKPQGGPRAAGNSATSQIDSGDGRIVPRSAGDILTSGSEREKIDYLANLPFVEYERLREIVAGVLGYSLEALDARVDARRRTPVGAALLDDVEHFLRRFVCYPSDAAIQAHALWIAHAHSMDRWDSTPRLAFLSPEPGSGKTRALEVSELLVPHAVEAINATPAYLFRRINDPEGLPTILFDEIDTIFGPKSKKDNEEIRGVINAGHRKGAVAGRCVVRGKEIFTEELPAYCAVAMAGLGDLPDTILTRSVIVRMRRRSPSEEVEPFRRRLMAPEGHALRDRLAEWADKVLASATDYPVMPSSITDRAADVWEPLLSVADAAGGRWPEVARVAAVALVADAMRDSPSLGIRLLTDLKTVFGGREAMSTAEIITTLTGMDESPWGDLKGRPIGDRTLANILRRYGVRSRNIRTGTVITKGYTGESLFDTWQRYLPVPRIQSATPATSATTATELVL